MKKRPLAKFAIKTNFDKFGYFKKTIANLSNVLYNISQGENYGKQKIW